MPAESRPRRYHKRKVKIPKMKYVVPRIAVFIDTCVLRHAADRRIIGRTYSTKVRWGGTEQPTMLTRWAEEYPNERLHRSFRRQLSLLPLIAHLARRGRIRLLFHREVRGELAGLPPSNDPRGIFYGAPITMVKDPFTYSRAVTDDKAWIDLLLGVNDPEFLAIQKVTGARQGQQVHANQLLDAFHILCAHRAQANYFLTTDLKLVKSVRAQHKHPLSVAVIDPCSLIIDLLRTRTLRLRDFVSHVVYQVRTRGRGPENHPLEQLRIVSESLGKRDRQ